MSESHEERTESPWGFCRRILGSVSRTFALTIPVLPEPLSDTVTCAYLLCRIADTVEDERSLGNDQRAQLFDLLGHVVDNPDDQEVLHQFVAAWPHERAGSYDRLMQGASEVLECFRSLPPADQQSVQRCTQEMINGMRVMTGEAPGEEVVFVSSSLRELELYCHYVAGTVGQMLTRLFSRYVGKAAGFSSPERVEQGRRFGIGLQLTNILKDLVADRAAGISFIPREWLRKRGPREEMDPARKRFLVERTLSHLDIAHRFTLALPREEEGIRLFCVWALWMAVTTLREICSSNAAEPKISRDEVQEIISFSKRSIKDDEALDRKFQELRQEAARAAAGLASSSLP